MNYVILKSVVRSHTRTRRGKLERVQTFQRKGTISERETDSETKQTIEPEKYYYHVTYTEKLPSIKRKGLLPMQTTNWVQSANKERYGKGEIYSFEHVQDALRWAAKMDWDFNTTIGSGKISIVKFKGSGKKGSLTEWTYDEADPISQSGASGKWLKRMAAVPSSEIVSSVPFTHDMVKFLTHNETAEDKDLF
jgi:hypothetical protein